MDTKMNDEKRRECILVVDDDPANLMVLNQILSSEYTVLTAKTGEEALDRAQEEGPDLILLDILLPGIDGFEVLRKLKASVDTQFIPVMFITALDKDEDEEKGLLLGAVDYITKPFRNGIVLARVRAHLQILRQMRMIEHLGLTDPLTNIPNRRCFDDHLAVEWKRAIRNKRCLSFLMMDLDKFKIYNDTYGHPQGDVLLISLARIFATAARRPGDLAARIGGEEFGLLLPDTEAEAARQIAEEIRAEVEGARIPLLDGKLITRITISIGVSGLVPSPDDPILGLLKKADQRLYKAKESGRNRVCAED
jgi:diguanylate cyclase (GGDEF)-like protein